MKQLDSVLADIEHLFGNINWGQSYLDARAARVMNEIFDDIRKLAKGGEKGEIIDTIESTFDWIDNAVRDIGEGKFPPKPDNLNEFKYKLVKRIYLQLCIGREKRLLCMWEICHIQKGLYLTPGNTLI